MALRLLEQGSRLVLSARTGDVLGNLAAELAGSERVICIPADLTVPGEAARLAREAEQAAGRIDVLINGAGVGYFALVEEVDEERLREVFELNAFAPLLLAREVLPGMKQSGAGRIVNIGAAAGRVPIPSVGVYGGAKTALALIAATMRFELAGSGVRVINIYPSAAATEFEDHALRENERPGVDPQQCFARDPEECADAILEASRGNRDEVWIERKGRKLALGVELWPRHVERRLAGLRDRVVAFRPGLKPRDQRRWRRWSIEAAGRAEGDATPRALADAVWSGVREQLPEIAELVFGGPGEPLDDPQLVERIAEAREAGCEVSLVTRGHPLDAERSKLLAAAGLDRITLVAGPGASCPPGTVVERGQALRALAGPKERSRGRMELRCVLTPDATDGLEEWIHAAAELGVSKLCFEIDCIVHDESPHVRRRWAKVLARASRTARRLGLESATPRVDPSEQPVCTDDPCETLFVRHDGALSPCHRLAYGGPALCLGKSQILPQLHYGHLQEEGALSLWEQDTPCRGLRARFAERVRVYTGTMFEGALEPGISRLQRAEQRARERMPPPPDSCQGCPALHQL